MKLIVFILSSLLITTNFVQAALSDGDIVQNFTLTKYGGAEGETLSLYDYEGHIIVLDFFAYWCGPCQTSSPEIEKEIADYYAASGGTANNLPVTVIAVSIDNRNTTAVDSFIQNAGLKLVGLDETQKGWSQFGLGYIPHFAVVNGVANANYSQWEVVHTNYGYRGASFYKNIAESVETSGGFAAWAELNISDSNARAPMDDSDLDGMSNLLEYACGTNPNACEGHSALNLLRDQAGDYLLNYTESKATTGLATTIEMSNDLIRWTPLPTDTGTVRQIDLGEQSRIELTIPSSKIDAKFWRRSVRLASGQ